MFDIISHCQLKREKQSERHKGGMAVCSPLTDNVMIRGVCSLCMSELPLCSSDPYDTSSGSLQLISIKPLAAQTNYSHPSDRSQDSAVVNGEVMHTQTIHLHKINENFKGPEICILTTLSGPLQSKELLLKLGSGCGLPFHVFLWKDCRQGATFFIYRCSG